MEEAAEALGASSLAAGSASAPGGRALIEHRGMVNPWVDVTPLLAKGSDCMELGDLLSGRAFEMQEAMSALEIFDPQMDTGMHSKENKEEESAIPPPPDVPSGPLLVGLLDDVLCAEHGWYSGHTLAQTVYAVEWIQCAPELTHLPLRAALCATARGVAAARNIVLRADIHEEEEFASTLSGLKLHDRVQEQHGQDEDQDRRA